MSNYLVIYQDVYQSTFSEWSENVDKNIIAINITNDIVYQAFSKNVIFKEMWDYYNFEELANIDSKALSMAQTWYIDNSGNDITEFRGISIGEVIQHEMMTYFVSCIKSIDIIRRIIEQESIEKIVLFGCKTPYERAALDLSTQYNLEVEKKYETSEEQDTWDKCWPYLEAKIPVKSSILSLYFQLLKIRSKLKTVFNNKKSKKRFFMISPYRVVPLLQSISKRSDALVTMLVHGYIKDLKHGDIIDDDRITLTPRWPLISLLKPHTKSNNIARQLAKKGETLIKQKVSSLQEDISTLIEGDLFQYLESNIKKCIIDYDILKPYIKRRKFDMIVLVHDFKGIHRLAIAIGNYNNIHTLVLQHGALGFYPHFISPISKSIGVWEKTWGNWFTKYLNVPEDKIVSIGEPFYDKYFETKVKPTDDLLEKYNIPKAKKVVLLSHQEMVSISALEFPGLNRKMAYQFFNIAREMRDCFFIFKLRPGNSSDFGNRIVEAANAENVKVITKADNHELLSICDALVTRCSTQAFEAIILDKPVLLINYLQSDRYNNGEYNPFMQTPCAKVANTLDEVKPALNSLLYDEDIRQQLSIARKSFIDNYYVKDKNASNQLANYIMRIN